jgi:hypothetical protein
MQNTADADFSRMITGEAPVARFTPRPLKLIECPFCVAEFAADPDQVSRWRRMESSVAFLMTCPRCSTAGLLVLQAGPEIPEEHAIVLAALVEPRMSQD